MKQILRLFAVTLFATASSYAQQPAPSPVPVPAPTPGTTRVPAPATRTVRLPSFGSMALPPAFGSPIEADPMARRLMAVQRYAAPMYRKPNSKELRLLVPDTVIAARFAEVLKRKDSGIFKLVPDAGCSENTKVVSAAEKCLKYLFPGAGSSFSFRTKSYRPRQLADLTYTADGLVMTGVLMHGLMVDLGDVPIETVSLNSPTAVFVRNFSPVDDFKEAVEVDKLLSKGIRNDGFLYRRSLPVAENHTYVLRAIAYQGRVMRAVSGADYNELDFDKRTDLLAAFRVAKIDGDGSLTIVWRKLASGRSPKLKIPVRENPVEFAGDTPRSPMRDGRSPIR